VFLPRSDRANPDLPVALRRHGAHVTEVIAYRTMRPSEINKSNLSRIAAGEADAVLFFSPTAVQHFEKLLGSGRLSTLEHRLAITAVGPVTAHALQEAGVRRMVVAVDTTTQAVVETLEKYFAGTLQQSSAGAKRG
jgi:uroporphyrinogen-III synthase